LGVLLINITQLRHTMPIIYFVCIGYNNPIGKKGDKNGKTR